MFGTSLAIHSLVKLGFMTQANLTDVQLGFYDQFMTNLNAHLSVVQKCTNYVKAYFPFFWTERFLLMFSFTRDCPMSWYLQEGMLTI